MVLSSFMMLRIESIIIFLIKFERLLNNIGVFVYLQKILCVIMASAIASIPVLKGNVAEEFEAQAKKTYDEYLKQTSCLKIKNRGTHYEHSIQTVRNILAKSRLKGI